MLPPQLPPPIPYVAPAPVVQMDMGFELVAEESAEKIGPKRAAFEKAVKNFEQSLAGLPDGHKKEIEKFHSEVDRWADEKRAGGEKADKLSNFVGRVMIYAHKRLLLIEQKDPQLVRMKAEHTQLQTLFMNGDKVINSYLAWIRAKNEDEPKPDRSGRS